MGTEEKRIKGLETRSQSMAERLAKIEGHLGAAAKSANPLVTGLITFGGVLLAGYLGWAGITLVQQGNKLAEIYELLSPSQRLALIASHPEDPASIEAAQQILRTAKETGTEFSPDLIANTGQKFIRAAGQTEQAWDAALQFLDYRSFLSANSAPKPQGQRPLTGQWEANFEFKTGPPIPREGHITMADLVAREDAALAEPIGRSLLPSSTTLAPAFLILDTVSVSLDGYRFKNVIFRNSTIKYDGGPLRMENVYFVNCTFEIPPNQHGREFAEKVITGVATSADIG